MKLRNLVMTLLLCMVVGVALSAPLNNFTAKIPPPEAERDSPKREWQKFCERKLFLSISVTVQRKFLKE